MNQGVYAIYGSEGNYVLVLSRKDRGKFLFQVKDGSDKSPISKWYYWSPSA